MRTRKDRISENDRKLLGMLDRHPQMRERIETILQLAEGRDGEPGNADEVEGKLVECVRELGRNTMQSWAEGARDKLEDELREREEGVHRGKKKL